MTILSALAKAYDRLPNAPPFGYSAQGILYCLVIDHTGRVVGDPVSLASDEKGKPIPRVMNVPYFGGRSGSNPPPYFLWDNSAYVLGKTAKGFDAEKRFSAFKEYHLSILKDAESLALKGFVRFLEMWDSSQFQILNFPDQILDRNIVFRLVDEKKFIHEGDEAKTKWNNFYEPDVIGERICLISGEPQQIARLHPPIATFDNPARIVSFDRDNDSFSSYGHIQAENAPTGVKYAFAYTAVLNNFLSRGSGHRIQIGDASTVFWADASEAGIAEEAEMMFPVFFDTADKEQETEEKLGTKRIRERLEQIRIGVPLEEVEPDLGKVQFYVLGLAPNAARLSIRFFHSGNFGALTRHYQQFVSDMRIEPPPRDPYPPLWRYLRETAVLGKSENVTPNLAGEWMRSILSGMPYPLALLSSVLTRIRADGEINALRAGILKALLIRNFKSKEASVALDLTNKKKGYLLGRLFAVYEHIQTAALGPKVNATIKDKFYGSASAQPRKVFHLLESGSANHLSKIGKQKPGYKVVLEKQVGAIMDLMSPGADPFPASLAAEDQALFGLGYYHQRNEFFKKPAEAAVSGEIDA